MSLLAIIEYTIIFWLNFASIFRTDFVLIFNGSHAVSFTFNIVGPGPNSLLNNTVESGLVAHKTFPICLDKLAFREVLLAT